MSDNAIRKWVKFYERELERRDRGEPGLNPVWHSGGPQTAIASRRLYDSAG